MNISVLVADESHTKYAQAICDEIAISAKERGTGIAKRRICFHGVPSVIEFPSIFTLSSSI